MGQISNSAKHYTRSTWKWKEALYCLQLDLSVLEGEFLFPSFSNKLGCLGYLWKWHDCWIWETLYSLKSKVLLYPFPPKENFKLYIFGHLWTSLQQLAESFLRIHICNAHPCLSPHGLPPTCPRHGWRKDGETWAQIKQVTCFECFGMTSAHMCTKHLMDHGLYVLTCQTAGFIRIYWCFPSVFGIMRRFPAGASLFQQRGRRSP